MHLLQQGRRHLSGHISVGECFYSHVLLIQQYEDSEACEIWATMCLLKSVSAGEAVISDT